MIVLLKDYIWVIFCCDWYIFFKLCDLYIWIGGVVVVMNVVCDFQFIFNDWVQLLGNVDDDSCIQN